MKTAAVVLKALQLDDDTMRFKVDLSKGTQTRNTINSISRELEDT